LTNSCADQPQGYFDNNLEANGDLFAAPAVEIRHTPECPTQWANSYYFSTLIWGIKAGNPNLEIHYQFANGKAMPFEVPQNQG
jgi:hypothetical protein